MKKLITALSILTMTTTINNVTNTLVNANEKTATNNDFTNTLTHQDTIYIDENGKQQITSEQDLSNLNSKEIIQIGFYKNINSEIQAVRMPKIIEKVPVQLPTAITSLKAMFAGSLFFNQNISKWDTSKIVDMSFTFNGAIAFNQNLTMWNVSNVKTMMAMFAGAITFNQDIANWKVDNVKNFSLIFYCALTFNQDLSEWNPANAIDMSFMFYYALSFNQDLSKWNVNKVTAYSNFATYSAITDTSKLPKFNK